MTNGEYETTDEMLLDVAKFEGPTSGSYAVEMIRNLAKALLETRDELSRVNRRYNVRYERKSPDDFKDDLTNG